MQQHGSKYVPADPSPRPWDGVKRFKLIFFSEHGQFAYQIKGNHLSNMVANILPADHPLRHWIGVRRSKFNFFRTSPCCMSNLRELQMQQYGCNMVDPDHPDPRPWGFGQKVKTHFFQNMVMLHIKYKGMEQRASCKHIFSPYTHPQLWVGLKGKKKM